VFHKVSRHLVNLTMPMVLPFRVFGWAVCDNVPWLLAKGLYTRRDLLLHLHTDMMLRDQTSFNGNTDDQLYAAASSAAQFCAYEFQCCLQVAHSSEPNQSC